MIQESLGYLGMTVKDRVTGFSGMVSSVTFDAYGCIQAFVTPRMVEAKLGDGHWFDLSRLMLGDRVMVAPTFGATIESIPGGNALPRPAQLPMP